MAPTEGRVAKPEWRWGCRRGTLSHQEENITEAPPSVCQQSRSINVIQ